MRRTPTELATFMHNVYEYYAEKYGWQTQLSTRKKNFSELPKENRKVMLAVARILLQEIRGGRLE